VLRQKKETNQGTSAARGLKEAQVFAVVNKGHNEKKKTYFHKQNKEALVSGNEEYDDGE